MMGSCGGPYVYGSRFNLSHSKEEYNDDGLPYHANQLTNLP